MRGTNEIDKSVYPFGVNYGAGGWYVADQRTQTKVAEFGHGKAGSQQAVDDAAERNKKHWATARPQPDFA